MTRTAHPVAAALCAFALLTIAAPIPSALACKCKRSPAFMTLAKRAPLVVHVRVAAAKRGARKSVTFNVVRALKGETRHKVMTLQGGAGKDCRVRADRFKAGQEYLIALDADSPAFWLSTCRDSYAPVQQTVQLKNGEKKTLDELQKELGKVK